MAYHKIDVLLVDLCLIDRFASAIMLNLTCPQLFLITSSIWHGRQEQAL